MRKQDHNLTQQLQAAFDFFNRHLWDGRLPPVVITVQRKANTYGYYRSSSFINRQHADSAADEIAMNPDDFDRPDAEILATLAHEMAHHWHQYNGKPGRKGYHHQEWANEMLRIGLKPFNYDQPSKMTGQSIHHQILPNGLFAAWCAELLASGYSLQWRSRKFAQLPPAPGEEAEPTDGEEEKREEEAAKKKNKTKYTCPVCKANIWGKPGLDIICGTCAAQYAEQ